MRALIVLFFAYRRTLDLGLGLVYRFKRLSESQDIEVPRQSFPDSPGVFDYELAKSKLRWADGKECYVNVAYLEASADDASKPEGRTLLLLAIPSQIGCGDQAVVCFSDASYEVVGLPDLHSLYDLNVFELEDDLTGKSTKGPSEK